MLIYIKKENTMFILYPQDYFNKKNPDESFLDETEETKLLFSIGTMFSKNYQENDRVLYRGWMLNSNEYDELEDFINKNNLSLITTKEQYYSAHHMNNWYERVKDITPETLFFKDVNELVSNLDKLDWTEYFIKDSVKSLTTTRGSIAKSKEEVVEVIREIENKKGIEGVISLRKVHNFKKESEIRYFSINGKVFSPTGILSDLAIKVAKRFSHLSFISIDIIKDEKDKEWLVEIGDGQVSDMKMWNPKDFANILNSLS